ncbi:MAG: LysM peptidoglycan-binding domain-containing protein [Clostridiales bacterium]|nr:LysM peptidoglycan-binding domain-containing protein [Clostridiales bacterium]
MNEFQMAFKTFIWPHNPQTLHTALEEQVSAADRPGTTEDLYRTGRGARTVTGSGAFFGPDAAGQAAQLEQLYREGTPGPLLVPNLTPMTALFVQFQLEASARRDVIPYQFCFREAVTQAERDADAAEHYTYAAEGETLFHIANRCGLSFSRIMELNAYTTHYGVRSGEQVRLK